MSERRLKTLFLNGIAVGQYQGSEDLEKDLQAAREELQQSGLYKPPTLLAAMRGQAVGFAAAANLAFEQMKKRGPSNPPLTMAPFVVNSAFAVELYLKTLLRSANIGYPKRGGHGLLKLHALLPPLEQVHLESLTEQCTLDYDPGTAETFVSRLEPVNEAFVRWRYSFEYERAGRVRPRSLILVMKVCHEACCTVA